MKRFLALVPFLALAACTAAPNDAASTDEDLVADQMCATLDYGPRGPAADVYQFYATTDDATTYMQQLEASGYVQIIGGPTAHFREVTSDPRITKLVGDAFEGMRRVFPRETADLPTAPPVAIIDTPVRNAYALPAGLAGSAKAPWLFVVHSAILTGDDDALMGVIAHELGHLILRNYAADVRPHINATYLVDASGEDAVFGAKQANDPALAQRVNDIIARERRVGLFPELGFGTPYAGYQYGLKEVAPNPSEAARATLDACKNVEASVGALKTAQAPFIATYGTVGAQPKRPTDAELTNLQTLSDAALAELNACFATVQDPTTLAQLLVEDGIPAAILDQWMLQTERDADANASLTSAGARILWAESRVRAEVVALRNDPAQPYSRVRMYDSEEDSDDASIRVMRAMGRDPTSNGRFLLDSMQPAAKADCLAAVAAGMPVDFGEIRDVHPASCWRYYHAVQLSKSLETCAPVPTRTRAPSGGNALVRPADPLEFIGKSYGVAREN